MRGLYDVAGLRGDADFMVWWHAEPPSSSSSRPTTASCARRSASTSSRSGATPRCTARPSSTRATSRRSWPTSTPASYVCVYPFVRSYEWYLLDEKERRDLLREHGQMARDYPDVRANTIASFALGDYEWLLAFEADELHRIVDLMRELRASGLGGTCARRSPSSPARSSTRPTSSPTCADALSALAPRLSCRGSSR